MRRSRLAAVVVVVAILVPAGSSGQSHDPAHPPPSVLDATVHMRPVNGPIVDPFRPPPQPWLPGNRGIEYDTEPGSVAIAPG